MSISIVHPSRSRPGQALKTYHHWLGNMSSDDRTYIVSIDDSDPERERYIDLFKHYGNHVLVSNNHSAVDAANAGAALSVGGIIVLVSDDFTCFPDWDLAVTKALEGKSGVLKTFDGVQKWIVTLPIMTRDYYEEQGHIYNPMFSHQFCDTHLTHRADLKGKLIIRNDIVFHHAHYSTKGGQSKDAVNVRADSTWDSGKKLYLQECINKFGLGNNIDIFNLSDTARQAGHINWLKNELRKFKG